MDAEKLKAMLEEAVELGTKQREENEALKAKLEKLTTDFEAVKDANDGMVSSEMVDELKSQISDLEAKMKRPVDMLPEDTKKVMKEIAGKAIGNWVKGNSSKDLFDHVKSYSADHFKSVNITNPADGGLAVAEVLSSDIMDRAREYSPILGLVGRKPNMTRNFRETLNLTFPAVEAGIENVAGNVLALTDAGTYVDVVSKEFKASMRPFITDEAMYGADLDLYGDLVDKGGREMGVYLAAQVLFGDGTSKNCRGILSSNRVDITNGTGESFKPTFGAGARDVDVYPVKTTGVDGSLGATSEAIVDLVVDITNELPSMHLSGAGWTMNRKTKGLFEKVKDADGHPIFKIAYSESGNGMRLNGYPVVIDDTMPDVASNSTPIIFGRLDMAFRINDGDIDKILLDPYSRDGGTTVKMDKEMFEMVGHNNAIIVVACTTNAGA
jgi:HK97 family phage major capsid protein